MCQTNFDFRKHLKVGDPLPGYKTIIIRKVFEKQLTVCNPENVDLGDELGLKIDDQVVMVRPLNTNNDYYKLMLIED